MVHVYSALSWVVNQLKPCPHTQNTRTVSPRCEWCDIYSGCVTGTLSVHWNPLTRVLQCVGAFLVTLMFEIFSNQETGQ